MPSPDGFVACALSSSAHTVAEARGFTRATLKGWKVCPGVTEDATVVVSELVSNALRYGIGTHEAGDATPDAFGTPGRRHPAWLALTRQESAVLCAVSDAGTGTPVVAPQDPLAESGRGLLIVDRLSDAWGWTAPDRSGKTVWATVAMCG